MIYFGIQILRRFAWRERGGVIHGFGGSSGMREPGEQILAARATRTGPLVGALGWKSEQVGA